MADEMTDAEFKRYFDEPLAVLADENAIEDAIVYALAQGGVDAWRGDGVGIVANMIRHAVEAEARRLCSVPTAKGGDRHEPEGNRTPDNVHGRHVAAAGTVHPEAVPTAGDEEVAREIARAIWDRTQKTVLTDVDEEIIATALARVRRETIERCAIYARMAALRALEADKP